ncbi:MAG: hypothetical protein WCC84_01555 [Candidatus Cybelea sp.]
MTLRKVPGVLAWGLLASLAAHAALYRGEHAMGGPYHALLLQGAFAAGLSLIVFLGTLAWSASGATADGSVVASRLRDRLPNLGTVMASAGAWYALAEAAEPQHAAASPVFAFAVLALSACLVLRLAAAVARAIGAAVFAIRRTAFAPRMRLRFRLPQLRPLARRPLFTRRRFARPPPIAA